MGGRGGAGRQSGQSGERNLAAFTEAYQAGIAAADADDDAAADAGTVYDAYQMAINERGGDYGDYVDLSALRPRMARLGVRNRETQDRLIKSFQGTDAAHFASSETRGLSQKSKDAAVKVNGRNVHSIALREG